MDTLLFDDLLLEIFRRLIPPSSSVPLVSRRWLLLHRSSISSLSLSSVNIPFLSLYSSLTSLTLILSPRNSLDFSQLHIPSLLRLRLPSDPVTGHHHLPNSFPNLTSLSLSLPRPLSLSFLSAFKALTHLSLSTSNDHISLPHTTRQPLHLHTDLPLKILSLSKVGPWDEGIGWLWNNCKGLTKLALRNCQGVGDWVSFSHCISTLRELELRTCRAIFNAIMSKVADICTSLNTLLVYDGGCRDGLLMFMKYCRCDLTKLDLRLPLDLNNDHLFSISESFQGSLTTLRIQSCCLVTREGLDAIGLAMAYKLEELALTNCDVVEKEPGLLITLGQNLKCLRKLDLSHNEMLFDKEFCSMLVSCSGLIDLKLRGCKGLTGAVMYTLLKNCSNLERVDIVNCCKIEVEAVEFFVRNSRLRKLQVEASKLSDDFRARWSYKFADDDGSSHIGFAAYFLAACGFAVVAKLLVWLTHFRL